LLSISCGLGRLTKNGHAKLLEHKFLLMESGDPHIALREAFIYDARRRIDP
jgi:hypothetical protein